ncbi:hypothetical protein TRFO_27026 [Tritrichomonas foetus]|uniref:CCR4-Not complex component Not1 C-terminal domain-containing protein n=1 Tax=Tritrichomonas foetus TaxID=1144522 RepID=A0A1J4K368_9EUKA|nr:hypothetical protein TRFO_27026 [Tritrichomonas foetus]|eukprot:OHT05272.1 hypothetical protein TRFO_27026 [Tritrichomonas foetus]
MKKCKYPTKIQNDFSPDQIKRVKTILSRPLKDIHASLCELLAEHKNTDLTCILRHLLDSPISETTVSIIGWFFVNSLIPVPVAFLYLKMMMSQLNTPKGFILNHLFARAIFPRLPKYGTYCKSLLTSQALQYYDNELYISIKQLAHEPVCLDYFDTRIHFVLPRTERYFSPITYFEQFSPLPASEPLIQLKHNLFNSIEHARTLTAEQQRLYCVNICLTYPPTSVRIRFPPFLSAICSYSKLLLHDSSNVSWEAFEVHPQLERMGSWIGALTVSQGRPPPLYMLNIPSLLRESIQNGTLGHALVFLTAFYTKVSSLYQPPNPVTNLILEILAAVLRTPGIRTDIIEKIHNFGDLLKVDVSLFFNRNIVIPENSFDRCAQFSTENGSTVFQPAALLSHEVITRYNNFGNSLNNSMNNIDNGFDLSFCLNSYFHYVPNHGMLPQEQQTVFNGTQRIEKYYFVESTSHLMTPRNDRTEQEMLQCIVSLAIADSPILARTASALFKKVTKGMPPLDLAPIFRCAFPNKYILSACLNRHCFAPADINSLFSELLTNPVTAPIAKPMIQEFMPMCFELCPDYSFASVRELAGIPQRKNPTPPIPQPSASHIPLLRAFLNFSRNHDDSSRSEFTAKMSTASVSHIVSLISFVFCATVKRNSPKTPTAIDYSAIDSLCFALGKCAGRIDNGTLTSNCFQAIENIAQSAIDLQPKALFRLVNGLFTWLHFRSKMRMIELLEFLSPSHFPSFSLCWIQLVMHRAAFPNLVRTNESRPMQFCLNFIITCLRLVIDYPDVFYRGVVRILMTTASCAPLFFISYHELFLEHIPLRFVQLRNIILSATVPDGSTPPIGFDYSDTLKSKAIIAVIDPILQKKENDNATVGSNAVFITSILKRSISESNGFIPRIVWQFVFYCVAKSAEINMDNDNIGGLPVVHLFCSILSSFNDASASPILEAVVDQLKYPNNQTTFASSLLFSLFSKSETTNHKELILVTLIKRLMCVTPPPQSVRSLFKKITMMFGNDVREMLIQNDELEAFRAAEAIVVNAGIKRSSSGRIIVEHDHDPVT